MCRPATWRRSSRARTRRRGRATRRPAPRAPSGRSGGSSESLEHRLEDTLGGGSRIRALADDLLVRHVDVEDDVAAADDGVREILVIDLVLRVRVRDLLDHALPA